MEPKVLLARHCKPGKIATIAALHERAIEMVEKSFAERGRIEPLWLLRSHQQNLFLMVATDWHSHEEQHAAFHAMHKLMRGSDVFLYSHATECQLLDRESEQLEDVLMVQTYDAKGRNSTTRYGVIFPPGRQVSRKHPWGKLLARDDWGHCDSLDNAPNLLTDVHIHRDFDFATTCPVCQALHDCAGEVTPGWRPPQDGDFTMCFSCGAWLVFASERPEKLRRPDMSEFRIIAADPDLGRMRVEWARVLKEDPRRA